MLSLLGIFAPLVVRLIIGGLDIFGAKQETKKFFMDFVKLMQTHGLISKKNADALEGQLIRLKERVKKGQTDEKNNQGPV